MRFLRHQSYYKAWSHLTRGAWIEIYFLIDVLPSSCRRTSHEVRGLKYSCHPRSPVLYRSHLTRGAWIEITNTSWRSGLWAVAPHTRCVDWNSSNLQNPRTKKTSHLTRGAWIEMQTAATSTALLLVAPHTRCVDWNRYWLIILIIRLSRTSHEVRGLKYIILYQATVSKVMSHLTRGAWIEIVVIALIGRAVW